MLNQPSNTTRARPMAVMATVVCAEGQRHRDLIVCNSTQEAQRIVDLAFPEHRYCSLMYCARRPQ